MISEALRAAYNEHRARPNCRASRALELARVAVEHGPRRYNESPWVKPYPAVAWQERSNPRSSEHFAHVMDPVKAGLRYVGRASTDRDTWDKRESTGWYTDPYGDVFTDGTGLCYGVVYQLPAREGKARFVAGYEFGGTDGGPTLDLGHIFESGSMAYAYTNPQDHDDAIEAARMANEHARIAAEHEREYQTAFAAGVQWADKGGEIATLRRSILDDLAARKTIKRDMSRVGVPLDSREWSRACGMFKARVEEALTDIAELRAARAILAAGDSPRLTFYPEQRLKDAFREGAGLA